MARNVTKDLMRYLKNEAGENGPEFIFDMILWQDGIAAHEKKRGGQDASELWPFEFGDIKEAVEQLEKQGKVSYIISDAGEPSGIKLEGSLKNKKNDGISITVSPSMISALALIIAIIALVVALIK